MKKIGLRLLCFLFLLIGISALLYPSLSNWLIKRTQTKVIDDYHEEVAGYGEEWIAAEKAKAQEYNDELTGAVIRDPFIPESGASLPENYLSVLNINGMIGNVEIPKIYVNLPIYHGTSTEVLKKGAGHLKGTAFPIGGPGTHSVLTGHTGLPSAKLFTDLEALERGDVFFIHVLDEILAYKIDSILVKEPDDTESLNAVPGEDYVTLITCTPYGINSHRLFVRGTRIPYVPPAEADETEESARYVYLSMLILIILFLIDLSLYKRYRRYKKKYFKYKWLFELPLDE